MAIFGSFLELDGPLVFLHPRKFVVLLLTFYIFLKKLESYQVLPQKSVPQLEWKSFLCCFIQSQWLMKDKPITVWFMPWCSMEFRQVSTWLKRTSQHYLVLQTFWLVANTGQSLGYGTRFWTTLMQTFQLWLTILLKTLLMFTKLSQSSDTWHQLPSLSTSSYSNEAWE